jgi:hypothetical protein
MHPRQQQVVEVHSRLSGSRAVEWGAANAVCEPLHTVTYAPSESCVHVGCVRLDHLAGSHSECGCRVLLALPGDCSLLI